MGTAAASARARVERLLELTRALLRPGAADRDRLRERWLATTGLSREGVDWALERCLELQPSEMELEALLAAVPQAPRAHVVLPGQVFVAAHRALALALASAPRVYVRPSRRDPTLALALAERAGGLFKCVEQLAVQPGDHVWAYGADLTLGELRQKLPAGATLHAHGSGFGVAVVDLAEGSPGADTPRAATAIAADTLCFDQRGCLSPRLVLALGSPASVQRLTDSLFGAMQLSGQRVPRGRLSLEERADESWYRQCAACFAPVLDTGHGTLQLRSGMLETPAGDALAALNLPPVGRHLQILAIARLEPALRSLEPWLTSVGCSDPRLEARVRAVLPGARVSPLGCMQMPRFDGPVDRRADPAGELLAAPGA